eukprot:CAMPEP_0204540388 /NCGR_PEP_ID=MMETSP0661-20131031/17444_1 /ASSEMBLY_ACC=CAM_ASM_000606 /TAXON_ID=109239 /ORGANISM="Alexandrium margalefi, Strain AMGDE01CS-322" /LENGTH=52 /DNA_ID=CAMNT_0051547039 /DNA_START=124 /DNA_END=282 /DNA_ORIENTATION=-
MPGRTARAAPGAQVLMDARAGAVALAPAPAAALTAAPTDTRALGYAAAWWPP